MTHARPEPGVVLAGEALDDVATQAAAAEHGTQGGRGDDLDRRDADAGEDDRQRQWQLHLAQHLAAAHAHAARGLAQVAVDAVHAGIGRGHDGRHGQQDHRQERGEVRDVAARRPRR